MTHHMYDVDTTVHCPASISDEKTSHAHGRPVGRVLVNLPENENLFNFWERARSRVATPTTDLTIVAKFIGSTLSGK